LDNKVSDIIDARCNDEVHLTTLKKQNIMLHEQHDNSSPISPYIKHYIQFAENVNKIRITTITFLSLLSRQFTKISHHPEI